MRSRISYLLELQELESKWTVFQLIYLLCLRIGINYFKILTIIVMIVYENNNNNNNNHINDDNDNNNNEKNKNNIIIF